MIDGILVSTDIQTQDKLDEEAYKHFYRIFTYNNRVTDHLRAFLDTLYSSRPRFITLCDAPSLADFLDKTPDVSFLNRFVQRVSTLSALSIREVLSKFLLEYTKEKRGEPCSLASVAEMSSKIIEMSNALKDERVMDIQGAATDFCSVPSNASLDRLVVATYSGVGINVRAVDVQTSLEYGAETGNIDAVLAFLSVRLAGIQHDIEYLSTLCKTYTTMVFAACDKVSREPAPNQAMLDKLFVKAIKSSILNMIAVRAVKQSEITDSYISRLRSAFASTEHENRDQECAAIAEIILHSINAVTLRNLVFDTAHQNSMLAVFASRVVSAPEVKEYHSRLVYDKEATLNYLRTTGGSRRKPSSSSSKTPKTLDEPNSSPNQSSSNTNGDDERGDDDDDDKQDAWEVVSSMSGNMAGGIMAMVGVYDLAHAFQTYKQSPERGPATEALSMLERGLDAPSEPSLREMIGVDQIPEGVTPVLSEFTQIFVKKLFSPRALFVNIVGGAVSAILGSISHFTGLVSEKKEARKLKHVERVVKAMHQKMQFIHLQQQTAVSSAQPNITSNSCCSRDIADELARIRTLVGETGIFPLVVGNNTTGAPVHLLLLRIRRSIITSFTNCEGRLRRKISNMHEFLFLCGPRARNHLINETARQTNRMYASEPTASLVEYHRTVSKILEDITKTETLRTAQIK
ncbi:MAG TPA: hypothetical protein VFQ26_07190 [Nitrospiraceae bacterium]|nr:hypothetical protein [Nitrospiraceae bacterium]